ncbi:MAG: hypothetical protein CVU29_04340 [Betaproteobacteria bacterium HGW-Betaproteobacteria-22]|nr:MAG: hypothetical protein CVU29_04340 [Betaproteobacteria bacterium HGW-Betaproteobacteria-22]
MQLTEENTPPDRLAHEYWKRCANTFLATDPTYYDRQQIILESFLRRLDLKDKTGLDVGCGNGRFSFVLGGYLKSVLAFDLSETLVDQAKAAAISNGYKHITFESRDLEDGFPAGHYDVVACMGVTSTIVDENAFNRLLSSLSEAVLKGGYLITKDSLNSKQGDCPILTGPYITIYRDEAWYELAIQTLGFNLLRKVKLAETEGIVNYIFLWNKI